MKSYSNEPLTINNDKLDVNRTSLMINKHTALWPTFQQWRVCTHCPSNKQSASKHNNVNL